MKKILITGKNSYIGNKFEEWLSQLSRDYEVRKISVRTPEWKNMNWSNYDVVLNVAGIVHKNQKKASNEDFMKINCELAFEIAHKAKEDKVPHFIQMSTMNVFGKTSGEITETTIPLPRTQYGKSKLAGDKLIIELYEKNKFHISIIRPPMVYGENSPGNYKKLSQFAKISPIFPKIKNKRSMIYIDNLSEFLILIIENFDQGIFYPQNAEYVSSVEMVEAISNLYRKKVHFFRIKPYIVDKLFNISIFEKIFSDLFYSKELSEYKDNNYQVIDFKKSIKNTELKRDNL